jgi:heme/copper-type cytochrome/quinol oxidase subunit 3
VTAAATAVTRSADAQRDRPGIVACALVIVVAGSLTGFFGLLLAPLLSVQLSLSAIAPGAPSLATMAPALLLVVMTWLLLPAVVVCWALQALGASRRQPRRRLHAGRTQ